MKEPHSESLANYADLESCAGGGDIAGEALTEALMGRLLSREIPLSGRRPRGQMGKATPVVASSQAAAEPGAVGEPVHVRKLLAREPGDLGDALPLSGRPVGEGARRTPHAYAAEESDWAVVPAKGPNKGGQPPAEDLEGRAWAEENVARRDTDRTPRRGSRDTGAGRRAERRLLWGLRGRHDPRQEPYELNAHVRICAGGAGRPASLPRPDGSRANAPVAPDRHRPLQKQYI